jgi:hypothetical protein
MNAVPIGVDINGLSLEHQSRIRQIGLPAWMDEQSRYTPVAPAKPSRYSLESRQARMQKTVFADYLTTDFRSVVH